MRKLVYSSICVLTHALMASTQPAGQPSRENLDEVLFRWEKAMMELKSFAAEVQRSTNDKALGTREDYQGTAFFTKSANKQDSSRACLELYKTDNPLIYEKYIYTNSILYEYLPGEMRVRVHKKKKLIGGQQETFLTFLGAEKANDRYTLEYKGSDKFYHHIRILPKERDRRDFSEARLSLYRSNNMPAQVWYHQPNGNDVTWSLSKAQINGALPNKHFEPEIPEGWTTER